MIRTILLTLTLALTALAQTSDTTKAKESYLFWASVGTHATSTVYNILTSWKTETVSVPTATVATGTLPDNRVAMTNVDIRTNLRTAVSKAGISAAVLVPQIFLRKNASLRKWFTAINFSATAANGVQIGVNFLGQ